MYKYNMIGAVKPVMSIFIDLQKAKKKHLFRINCKQILIKITSP